MSNDVTGGVSKRSLVLLGGLAALALNRDARRALVGGSLNAWQNAASTVDGRVKPALGSAAGHAVELAHEAARRSVAGLDTLREEAPARAQSLLSAVVSTASDLAGSAQERASGLIDEAQPVIAQGSETARRALKTARKSAGRTLDSTVRPALSQAQEAGLGLLSGVQDRVQDVIGDGLDTVEGRRRQAERTLARARKEAEKELRSARKHWHPEKLGQAVERKVAPLQKQLGRELKVLQKQAKLARRDDRRGAGALGGGLTTVALLGVGAVVMARTPALRQGILNAVDAVSPDAAKALHSAGRNVRNVVGSVWLDRMEEGTDVNRKPPAAPPFRPSTPPDTAPVSEVVSVKPADEAEGKGKTQDN